LVPHVIGAPQKSRIRGSTFRPNNSSACIRSPASLEPGVWNTELLGVAVAAIAFVDVDAAGLDPGQCFQLGNARPQGVAVKRVGVHCLGVQHNLAAPRFREGRLLGLLAGVATDTLQPNSYSALAFPLPMHSTSRACSAYTCSRAAGDLANAWHRQGEQVGETFLERLIAGDLAPDVADHAAQPSLSSKPLKPRYGARWASRGAKAVLFGEG
jgi:hypothetical protein